MDLFDKVGIQYNWITLLVGRKIGLIDATEVAKYAINYLSDHPEETDKLIIDLTWNDNESFVDEILQKYVNSMNQETLSVSSDFWELEKRKWRYVILQSLRLDILNYDVLLEKVSEVYSDMGYPKDMDGFIYYLPPKDGYDPAKHSKAENYRRMIQILDDFLIEEKNKLT